MWQITFKLRNNMLYQYSVSFPTSDFTQLWYPCSRQCLLCAFMRVTSYLCVWMLTRLSKWCIVTEPRSCPVVELYPPVWGFKYREPLNKVGNLFACGPSFLWCRTIRALSCFVIKQLSAFMAHWLTDKLTSSLRFTACKMLTIEDTCILCPVLFIHLIISAANAMHMRVMPLNGTCRRLFLPHCRKSLLITDTMTEVWCFDMQVICSKNTKETGNSLNSVKKHCCNWLTGSGLLCTGMIDFFALPSLSQCGFCILSLCLLKTHYYH